MPVSTPIKLGLMGYGKIAHDQHLPAIKADPAFELIAVASRNAQAEAVRNYPGLEAMLAEEPSLDAVILCQPPQFRFDAARRALLAGKHVFMEKPPGMTASEVEALIAIGARARVTLFASWHSRYAAGVAQAKAWIAARELRTMQIVWKEDVRVWHPGQSWIWEPGGFGVFDPGINALSILTEIVGEPVYVRTADLHTPANRQAPIAARLSLATAGGVAIEVELDWRQTGPQSWDIIADTGDARLQLHDGGNRLTIDGVGQRVVPEAEYPAMYRHFACLIDQGYSDVDLSPLRIVADAYLCGRSHSTEAFYD